MDRARIGIVGSNGYTGSELVRILSRHPQARIEILTSENHTGQTFSSIYPAFRGIEDRPLSPHSAIDDFDLDLVFLALPYGAAMEFVRNHPPGRYRIIDLSADFRLRSPDIYRQWYHRDHVIPDLLAKAVYGLPELNRREIITADLVANPGCYPTAAILLFAPLVKHGLIELSGLIIDGKSGVTGAGATARATTHFPDVFGNFRAYELISHRHTPEMEQALTDLASEPVQLLFTPHRLPIDRGILITAYGKATRAIAHDELQTIYRDFYAGAPFIRLVDSPPAVKYVRGSNYCDIFATYDPRTNHIIAMSAIDNLVKGASGQAVQNMNIMFGYPETAGLEQLPLSP